MSYKEKKMKNSRLQRVTLTNLRTRKKRRKKKPKRKKSTISLKSSRKLWRSSLKIRST